MQLLKRKISKAMQLNTQAGLGLRPFAGLCLRLGLSLGLGWVISVASFAQSPIGMAVKDLSLRDQHDAAFAPVADTQALLIVKSKAASTWVGDYLQAQPANFLTEHKAYYLADIHKMPKLISRMAALPKMKKLPYSVYLGRDAEDLAMFIVNDGCALVAQVADGAIAGVQEACDTQALTTAIK